MHFPGAVGWVLSLALQEIAVAMNFRGGTINENRKPGLVEVRWTHRDLYDHVLERLLGGKFIML
jgi:hypothetical protein